MLSIEEINCLGNSCNTTFGKQSVYAAKIPDEMYSVYQQYNECSIKCTFEGADPTILTLNYTSICHFADNDSFEQQKKTYENEARQGVNQKLKEVKDNFKKEAGRALKVKQKEKDDSIEIIQASIYAARRTAYYRYNVKFEIN